MAKKRKTSKVVTVEELDLVLERVRMDLAMDIEQFKRDTNADIERLAEWITLLANRKPWYKRLFNWLWTTP